jgi:hypothetical protein
MSAARTGQLAAKKQQGADSGNSAVNQSLNIAPPRRHWPHRTLYFPAAQQRCNRTVTFAQS